LALAAIPRKLLVFDDHVRIKYLSFRSLPIPADEVVEVSLRRFKEVWLTKRLWRCSPLALGLLAPAVYMKRRDGRAYFFDVRDRAELLAVLKENEMPASVGAATN
jgi:hypothetical protein